MSEFHQVYRLQGRVKPAVRANKKFSKDRNQKSEYTQYMLCREDLTSQAWVQRQQQEAYMLDRGVLCMAIIRFFVNRAFLVNSDIDNLVKTVLDSLRGVAFEDDRYVVACHSWQFVIEDGQDHLTHVEIISLA